MNIYISAEHTEIEIRDEVVDFLNNKGYNVTTVGPYNAEKSNYAIEGIKVGENIAIGKADFGIVMMKSGTGAVIAANKVRKVRAVFCDTVEGAKVAREVNDANLIGLSVNEVGKDNCLKIIETFLDTNFNSANGVECLDAISDYEESCYDC